MRATTYNKEVQERQKLAEKIVDSAKKYMADLESAAKYATVKPFSQ